MAEAARARRRARLALAACTGAAAGALGALGAAWWLWGAGAGAARGGSVGAGGGGGGGGAGAPPAGAGGGAGGGSGGGLEAHFAFVRAVADGTTAPALLPGLRARVHALADVGALTAELQAGGLGPAEKLRVWGALKECAFVRSLGGMWGGVLLVVLCRVQLCILGRHMYVESRMEEEAAGGGGGLGAPSLDPILQQAFLACAEGFCHRGAGLVVERMERAARGTVGHIGLDGTFRLPEAIGALAFLSATFEADAAARGWTELLVPRPEEEAADGAGAAAGGGVGAGAGAGARHGAPPRGGAVLRLGAGVRPGGECGEAAADAAGGQGRGLPRGGRGGGGRGAGRDARGQRDGRHAAAPCRGALCGALRESAGARGRGDPLRSSEALREPARGAGLRGGRGGGSRGSRRP